MIDGSIDCVVSDHSPCTLDLKSLETGNVMTAWGGISTLGLGLSLLWTEGRKRGVTLGQIVNWMSKKTAEHAGLQNSKGLLKVGWDGDLVLWDDETEFEASVIILCSRYRLREYFDRSQETRCNTRIRYLLTKV